MEALLLVVEHNEPTMLARIGIMRALNRHMESVFDPSRKDHHGGRRRSQYCSLCVSINQNKRDQRNNNHDGGEYSKSKAVPPTERSPILPANRWNVTGVIHLSFFKRAFDAEQASRALAFEGCTENSFARPHLSPSRLIHLILMRHGALLRGDIRQVLPPISVSSHHHKLALPIEVVRARARFLFLRAWQAP
jgi:hypothetical protein